MDQCFGSDCLRGKRTRIKRKQNDQVTAKKKTNSITLKAKTLAITWEGRVFLLSNFAEFRAFHMNQHIVDVIN